MKIPALIKVLQKVEQDHPGIELFIPELVDDCNISSMMGITVGGNHEIPGLSAVLGGLTSKNREFIKKMVDGEQGKFIRIKTNHSND